MTAYIVRRVLQAVPVLVGFSIVLFLMVRLMPGDVVDVLSGGDAGVSPEAQAAQRAQLGLDDSYPEQYLRWTGHALRGDLGRSLLSHEPVSSVLARALPVSLELVFLGLLIAVLIGVPLGILSAVRRDQANDYAARIGGLVGVSIPSFWLATLMLLFTSRVFGWVPPIGYVSPLEDPVVNLQQFILPSIAIAVFTLAVVMRMVRATMLEVLGQDYIRTARAKGVSYRAVVNRHALRNALIPVVTVVGFEVGVLMGSAALVEIIFGLPGLGQTLMNAIFGRDYAVVQGAAMLLAIVFIASNLVVDVLYGVLDPRIVQE
jgi:peptide/nickel transport system permease protein